MRAVNVPPWGGENLADLLLIEALWRAPLRKRCGDRNAHGRTAPPPAGGQVLAQALMAAADSAPAGRAPTAMQCLVLQGALHRPAMTNG